MGKARSSNPPRLARSVRLLIVEDSPADVELMVAALKRVGYSVTFDHVTSPQAFGQQLAQADYDVILSDHNLGTWLGRDALEMLQQSGKDIPFVVITATLGDEAAVEYLKRGATDYVLKHKLVQRLPVAVEQVLREKAHREQAARLQQQIARGKKEWELTFDTIPDPVLLLDEQCRVQRANRAAAEMMGLEFSQLLGRPCYEVVHGKTEPPSGCPHQRLLATGQPERTEVEEPHLGKVFDASATPLRDPDGAIRGSVYVLHDVTERRLLEEQLRQAQKMEAIGQLAGGIAHDFNNVLGVIVGFSDILLGRTPPADPAHRKLEQIKKAGDRAVAFTRQLLACSRKQVLQPRVCKINSIVSEMEPMLERLIGEDVEFATVLSPDTGQVKIDPGQFEQVILNLVVNARDAMPTGGKLTIETGNVNFEKEDERRHPLTRAGRYVMLAVSDTGVGMDAETQKRLFEPFFTTKEKGKGTGLGLATVYGIVKQSGGHIWFYSEPAQGTTFKIYLPRVDEPAEGAAVRPPPAETLPGSETILLVEDEPALREMAREFLEFGGYVVLEASTGHEALATTQQHDGPIHLLVTDVVLPEGMSGRALADEFKKMRPATKVLYASGYTDDVVLRHGVLELGRAFLQKPYSRDALLRKVREVLDVQ